MKVLRRTQFFFISIIIFLTSCSSTPVQQATEDVNKTPSQTVTVGQTKTSTVTPRVQPTPFVTVEEKTRTPLNIVDLFTTNGGCELPCWWGITPGKTKVVDAVNILNQLDSKINSEFNKDWIYTIITAPKKLSPIEQVEVDLYHENEIVQQIKVYGFNWPGYGLSKVLTTYGEPDEILIHSYKSEAAPYPDFRLVLIYATKGFVVFYGGGEGRTMYEGEDNVGCLGQEPTLHLYPPNKEFTHDELYGYIFGFYLPSLSEDDILRPVEEATGLDKHDFYMYYKQESNKDCIRTPKNIWVDG